MTKQPLRIGIYSPAPQSGKSTAASYLCSVYGFDAVSLAAPVKAMGAEFLVSFGYSREEAEYMVFRDKERIIPSLNKSVRYILQTIGTEWGRNYINGNVWVKIMLRNLELKGNVVVDDVRFFNEAEAIKAAGGILWKVVRPGLIPKENHASEGSLNNYDRFDRVIANDGTVEDLYAKIDLLIQDA